MLHRFVETVVLFYGRLQDSVKTPTRHLLEIFLGNIYVYCTLNKNKIKIIGYCYPVIAIWRMSLLTTLFIDAFVELALWRPGSGYPALMRLTQSTSQ
jgi:hypothetical protein